MNLVIFCHPSFGSHQSMPRYAGMLAEGMRQRGHSVKTWMPGPVFYRFGWSSFTKKWLGYLDQYVVFRAWASRQLRAERRDTLFVFADQALGPWVPLVKDRPHIIHCHDFLAQRSALGRFPENPTGWTGRQYQAYIRRGYTQGKAFLSVSHKTREDLHEMLSDLPKFSIAVHNGLNYPYAPMDQNQARQVLAEHVEEGDKPGFLLHVGGNQWYKNRAGVTRIYAAYCKAVAAPLPLWMVGAKPSEDLLRVSRQVPANGRVRFVSGLSNQQLCAAYNLAAALIYPSLEEGFGWPPLEAMACGTPVLTTNVAPMTEVGGTAAFYHRRKEAGESDESWAGDGAEILLQILSADESSRKTRRQQGLAQAANFSANGALDAYEAAYQEVLRNWEEIKS